MTMKFLISFLFFLLIGIAITDYRNEIKKSCLKKFVTWAGQCRCHNPFRRGRNNGRAYACIAANQEVAKATCGSYYDDCDIICPYSFVKKPGKCTIRVDEE